MKWAREQAVTWSLATRRVDFKANQLYCVPGQLSAYQNLFFQTVVWVLRLNPEKAAAIDAVMEVLSVSHTVVSTKDRTGKLKYEALVLAAVFIFFCRTFNWRTQGSRFHPNDKMFFTFSFQAESPDEGALVEAAETKNRTKTHRRHDIHKSPMMIRPSPQAVAKLGWCFTGRSNEGLTVELTDKNCLTYELLEPGTEFGEL